MKLYRPVVLAALCALGLSGCDQQQSSDQKQAQDQEAIASQMTMQVGMPSVPNAAERRMLRDIYELRDKMVPTITYIVDLNGHTHKLCDSLGFGIPYATQFTNPQKLVSVGGNGGVASLPQADPNGLFSPASAEGTWVMCQNPQTKKAAPLYVEPRIIVSEFPLN